jgi:polysaccharide export outer membrane protein
MMSSARLMLLLVLSMAFPAAAQDEPEYRLGAEDVVQIQVWGVPDMNAQVAIDFDGRLRLPTLGEVEAAGRTPSELGEELTQLLRILDPRVSEVVVSVTGYNSRSVTVVGEVRNPGRYGFRILPNLWDVVLAAGGSTGSADLARVEIVRKELQAGEPRIVRVDLSKVIEGADPAALPALRPKDTINVPSREADAIPTGDTFQVLGAVRTPGVYRLTTASTVVEALAAAGGPVAEANLSKVQLTRSTPQGVVAYRLDLEGHLFEGKVVGDFELRPGDTLTVPSRGITFGRALTGILPFVTVFTSLLVTYETLRR